MYQGLTNNDLSLAVSGINCLIRTAKIVQKKSFIEYMKFVIPTLSGFFDFVKFLREFIIYILLKILDVFRAKNQIFFRNL